MIRDLIKFYQTGEFSDWLAFGADWVQNNATVDFVSGFIEIYMDARGAKGSSQSFVSITDKKVNDADGEDRRQRRSTSKKKRRGTPKYKKKQFKPPVVKAVETMIETGDFHVNTVGDNLPNENEIHEKYGTKSFLFTGSSRALAAATGTSALKEFSIHPGRIRRAITSTAQEASDLITAMHEVIGHGSGKLESQVAQRGGALLEGIFLDSGRGSRRPDGAVECLRPEAERTGPRFPTRKKWRSDVQQRGARAADAIAAQSQGRHHRRRPPARPAVDRQLHHGQDRRHRRRWSATARPTST